MMLSSEPDMFEFENGEPSNIVIVCCKYSGCGWERNFTFPVLLEEIINATNLHIGTTDNH